MSHKERLLGILREAVTHEEGAHMEPWVHQAEAEKVESAKFSRWLGHHAAYWQPKDREYATYIQYLIKTWRAAVRGVTVEEVDEMDEFDKMNEALRPASDNKCLTCHQRFTDENPDYGGQVCCGCWGISH